MNDLVMNLDEPLGPNIRRDLLRAVEEGTLAKVKELLDQCPDLNVSEEAFDYLLLVSALKQGHEHIAELLVMKNCRVRISAQTKTHCTPLYYAVSMDNSKLFHTLYKNGASVHDKDLNQVSALELALASGKSSFVHHALSGPQFSKLSNQLDPSCENDVALFHAVCWVNSLSMINSFIAKGFSVRSCSLFSSREFEGFTPLHFALAGPTIYTTLVVLLKHNVDLHAKDSCGRTPLHLAFKRYSLTDSDFFSQVVETYVTRVKRENFLNITDATGLSHFHILCSTRFNNDRGSTICFVLNNKDAIDNRLSLLKYLIDNGIVDINDCALPGSEYYAGFSALHFAAFNCCYDVVKLLLESGADPTKVDHEGNTSLHVVSRNFSLPINEDALGIINLLLDHGVDVDAKNVENATVLHHAFYGQSHNQRLIQFFLSKSKSSFNHTDRCGLSHFHIACTGVDLSIVERLMMDEASIKACVESDTKFSGPQSEFRPNFSWIGCSALHFAIKFNRAEIVEYLLSHGADIHNTNDTTPLHLACAYELSRFFGSEASNVLKKTDWVPSRANQIRIIELLLKHGASVDAKNWFGNTPLFDTCTNYRYSSCGPEDSQSIVDEIALRQKEIIDILLRHGADINNCTENEERLLHKVTRLAQYDYPSQKNFIETLLKYGANLHVVDRKGLTPLHYVIKFGCNPSLVDLYLQYGADINAIAPEIGTPLHCILSRMNCASTHTRPVILPKLLSHPVIDLNAQNADGSTPLHIAMREMQKSLIEELLDAGADLNIEDASGFPPMHYLYQENDIRYHPSSHFVKMCITGVINHIKKLMRLKLPISQKVESYFEKLLGNHELHNSAADATIDAEVELLMTSKIDRFTSLYDILRKNASDMTKHVKNANFKELVSSAQLAINYPLFHKLLITQYKRGIDRGSLTDRAKEALVLVTRASWPDSCAEHILKYLNNRDLKMLIESTFSGKSKVISVSESITSKEHATKSP